MSIEAEINGAITDAPSADAEQMAVRRVKMVRVQLLGRDVRCKRVLNAMRKVPRHLFVPADKIDSAYEDKPLTIGLEQTISQPYIVGLMTQCLDPAPDAKILEIGVGSGYQTAVLAELSGEVHGVEIHKSLADSAKKRLRGMGYKNIRIHRADGALGWPDSAPYDGILVAAAPEEIPPALLAQLKIGARLVIPIGEKRQRLKIITRTESGIVEETSIDVRFVPMINKA